jgi:hypothetical protein
VIINGKQRNIRVSEPTMSKRRLKIRKDRGRQQRFSRGSTSCSFRIHSVRGSSKEFPETISDRESVRPTIGFRVMASPTCVSFAEVFLSGSSAVFIAADLNFVSSGRNQDIITRDDDRHLRGCTMPLMYQNDNLQHRRLLWEFVR